HERVHGEALRGPPDRCAPGVRRLRGGRLPDRGGAPPAVLADPARRGREGTRGRVQHPAAGARRRPPDRRPGPHGGLPQHRDRDDLQPGEPADPGTGGRRLTRGPHPDEGRGDGRRAGPLPPGVHQPPGRHRRLPPADQAADPPDRPHPAQGAGEATRRARAEAGAVGRGAGPAGRRRLRPGLWRPAAEAGDPAAGGESAGAEDPGGRIRQRGYGPGRSRGGQAGLREGLTGFPGGPPVPGAASLDPRVRGDDGGAYQRYEMRPYTYAPLNPNGEAELYGNCPLVEFPKIFSSGYSLSTLSPPSVKAHPPRWYVAARSTSHLAP